MPAGEYPAEVSRAAGEHGCSRNGSRQNVPSVSNKVTCRFDSRKSRHYLSGHVVAFEYLR
jgi:hypothetical protein